MLEEGLVCKAKYFNELTLFMVEGSQGYPVWVPAHNGVIAAALQSVI